MSGESFTCPVCGMTSHDPNDVREGYCGNCHDWTAGPETPPKWEDYVDEFGWG